MVTLTLFPGFSRNVNYVGESINQGPKRVYWSGIGKIYLEALVVDDYLELSGPNGVLKKYFWPSYCGPLQVYGPFDITYIFTPGANDIYAKTVDVCGGTIGNWGITITGDISFTPYTEASLASCQWPSAGVVGQTYPVTITVNQGSATENYKLVFSGDYAGETAPFTVNAGTGQQQFTVGNILFTTGGPKTVTASLVKI